MDSEPGKGTSVSLYLPLTQAVKTGPTREIRNAPAKVAVGKPPQAANSSN